MVSVVQPSHAQPIHKDHLLRTLRGLLEGVFRLRREGGVSGKLSAAQGYADGFMRALVEAKVCTHDELLRVVAEVRRGVDGPAVAEVRLEVDEAAQAAA